MSQKPAIDNKHFQDGRLAFNNGASLRDMFDHIGKLHELPADLVMQDGESGAAANERAEKREAFYDSREAVTLSVALGYADAFVEMLRRVSGEKRGGGQRA